MEKSRFIRPGVRKGRRGRRRVVASALLLAVVGTLVVVQPLWLIDVIARGSPGIVWRADTSQPLVALTFDDGPVPGPTSQALDLLGRYGARATFFMIGERAAAHPELVKRIRGQGHELGNHAYTGRRTLGLSEEAFLADLRRTEQVLDLRGPIKTYRPPSGLVLPAQLEVLRREGYRCVLGSAYPYDPVRPPSAYIEWLVAKNLAPGVIVILHDGIPDPSRTLEALTAILEAGRRKGLRFVTVGELLTASGSTASSTSDRRHGFDRSTPAP
jgi:peptidoglycan/xylan/chitin deacetylase (PgdA/CDA1 family)